MPGRRRVPPLLLPLLGLLLPLAGAPGIDTPHVQAYVGGAVYGIVHIHEPDSPSEHIMATTSARSVQLWRLKPDGGEITKLTSLGGHAFDVPGLAYLPDEGTLASASDDNNTIKLWNLWNEGSRRLPLAPQERGTLHGHMGGVYTLIYLQRELTLVSGSDDGTIQLWTSGGKLLSTIDAHPGFHDGFVLTLAYLPSPRLLASGSDDSTIRLWALHNELGLPIAPILRNTLTGHTMGVRALAVLDPPQDLSGDPHGAISFLASGCEDGSIIVWAVSADGARSRRLATLNAHKDVVYGLQYIAQHRILASCSACVYPFMSRAYIHVP